MRTLIALLILFGSIELQAQRFAYVDVKYILENVPEYAAAQEKLNEISNQWQGEVQAKRQELEKLFNNFRDEQVLYTDEMRQRKEEEIKAKEDDLNEFRNLDKNTNSQNTWSIDIEDINQDTFDLSVINPNIDEAVLPEPNEVLKEIEKLETESRKLLNEIKKIIK